MKEHEDLTEKITEELDAGNAFERFMRDHRNGLINAKATEKMHEAVEAARDRGAMASLIITLKFRPANDDQMMIEADVTNKLPKEKLPGGMMYVDEEGVLHKSDPKQKELELREVTRPEKDLREVRSKDVRES